MPKCLAQSKVLKKLKKLFNEQLFLNLKLKKDGSVIKGEKNFSESQNVFLNCI